VIVSAKSLGLRKNALRRLASRMLGAAEFAARMSSCSRAQVGAVIVLDLDECRVLADGYNGPPRGAGATCRTETFDADAKIESTCDRVRLDLASDERVEVGCHHAEQNALMNALRAGISTLGAVLVCTRLPCLACARAIHHAGLSCVVANPGPSGDREPCTEGVDYLKTHGVRVVLLSLDEAEALCAA